MWANSLGTRSETLLKLNRHIFPLVPLLPQYRLPPPALSLTTPAASIPSTSPPPSHPHPVSHPRSHPPRQLRSSHQPCHCHLLSLCVHFRHNIKFVIPLSLLVTQFYTQAMCVTTFVCTHILVYIHMILLCISLMNIFIKVR